MNLLKKGEAGKPGAGTPLKFTYDGRKLRAGLGRTYGRDEEYRVFIRYTAMPDRLEMGGSEAISQRSEEHTSELQSPMRISYAVFCLKKRTIYNSLNTYSRTRYHSLICSEIANNTSPVNT